MSQYTGFVLETVVVIHHKTDKNIKVLGQNLRKCVYLLTGREFDNTVYVLSIEMEAICLAQISIETGNS